MCFFDISPGLDFSGLFLTMGSGRKLENMGLGENSKLAKCSKVVPICCSLDLQPDGQKQFLCPSSMHQGSKPDNYNESVHCIDQCPLSELSS